MKLENLEELVLHDLKAQQMTNVIRFLELPLLRKLDLIQRRADDGEVISCGGVDMGVNLASVVCECLDHVKHLMVDGVRCIFHS